MNIAILTTPFFHDAKEVTRIIDGEKVQGKDRIIFGGGERYLLDLCKLIQDMGHGVTVYQPFPGIKKPFTKQYKGITFFMIPNNGGWEYHTCTDLNWQFNELSMLADLRIYFATYLSWPQAVSPCITISHGIYWDNIQGNNIINNFTEAQRTEFFRRQLYGFTAPDVVVSVDSNVRKVVQAYMPGAEKQIQIIYNYVDTKKFTPIEKKTWDGINVLFPRRLTSLRGSTEVTRAFMQHPEYNFTIVGQAWDENEAKAFIAGHKERKNVTFTHRETDDMPEVYQNADISLVPTMACEGLSLSLLESMATGLPVITTPVGGLGDACIHGYNCFIYDPNHEDLGLAIKALAEDEETRRKFGKRNREIAVECFDIEIWRHKWMNIFAGFGIYPGKQTPARKELCEIKKEQAPKKQKLVAMMLTHNEAGRYLERVIENTLLFCDEIVILDDHSTDDTKIAISEMASRYPNRIWLQSAENTWENENLLRSELLSLSITLTHPDWLIAIDADELYEAEKMNEQLPCLMSQTDADWVGFRFFDMWDEEHYRDDDIWPAGMSYVPRMFRVTGSCYEWPEKRRHCGSIPESVVRCSNGINSSVRVKHLGWMKPEDRDKKYLDRITDDPNCEFYPKEVYEAILDKNPTLVKWDDNNIWQTSKLTIGYPPGMEWDIMQQRPHHLLELAASERYRVLFGDDSANGTYEPIPYLTVVKDWESIKEVDILYITSPAQMERCEGIKYKKLIYDCCDWQNEADAELINRADYILCASKLLYDKIMSVKCVGNKSPMTENVIYLPNACDFDHFSKTGEPIPEAPEPIVGYMGCIHPVMIDENIVKAVAEKYKLLMIGQNKGVEFDHPNIYSTGHVPYEDLPKLLSGCSVAIIPFRTDSDYLKYSAPIKVYEYLAAGRPVVASPIPELLPLAEKGLIRIVPNDDLDGWVKAIEDAIAEYPNNRGKEYAKEQTWIKRWKTLKKECLE